MTIVKRLVVPRGENVASEEEWYDDKKGRVVPKPEKAEPTSEPNSEEAQPS